MSTAEGLRKVVLELHGPVEAVHFSGSRERRVKVCSGCGTDDGNWQIWPCPTVRAMDRFFAAESREGVAQ